MRVWSGVSPTPSAAQSVPPAREGWPRRTLSRERGPRAATPGVAGRHGRARGGGTLWTWRKKEGSWLGEGRDVRGHSTGEGARDTWLRGTSFLMLPGPHGSTGALRPGAPELGRLACSGPVPGPLCTIVPPAGAAEDLLGVSAHRPRQTPRRVLRPCPDLLWSVRAHGSQLGDLVEERGSRRPWALPAGVPAAAAAPACPAVAASALRPACLGDGRDSGSMVRGRQEKPREGNWFRGSGLKSPDRVPAVLFALLQDPHSHCPRVLPLQPRGPAARWSWLWGLRSRRRTGPASRWGSLGRRPGSWPG